MGPDFQDAFCGVSVAKKCTQVGEVIRLVLLFVYHRMSLLIVCVCVIDSLHSTALCEQVCECYHANVIVFNLYRK